MNKNYDKNTVKSSAIESFESTPVLFLPFVPLLQCLLISLLMFSASSLAQESSLSEEEIEQKISFIQDRLKIIKKDLNQAYGEEQKIIEQLEFHDQQINLIVKELKKSKAEIDSLGLQIKDLDVEIQTKSKNIEKQKQEIIDLLKLQIYINHDKTLKMFLLSPQSQKSDLLKHQLKYLKHQLYTLIKEVAKDIQALNDLKEQKVNFQNIEKIKSSELFNQQQNLVKQRSQRAKVLKQLKQQILSQEKESETLNKDQQRLQTLLEEIVNLLSDLPDDLGEGLNFESLKGRLMKPVKGRFLRSFRSFRSENTRWNGVVIEAKMNQDVKAVAYGRVAYAEWLRGFGMLVIVDHQGGYMSLYGFNQSLEVEVGDWVEPGQTVATAGDSGTLETPAVYFEIRKNANPQNPKKWFRK